MNNQKKIENLNFTELNEFDFIQFLSLGWIQYLLFFEIYIIFFQIIKQSVKQAILDIEVVLSELSQKVLIFLKQKMNYTKQIIFKLRNKILIQMGLFNIMTLLLI